MEGKEGLETLNSSPDKIISHEEFTLQVGIFPEEAQRRIASLSSLFLEKEQFDNVRNSPKELDHIVSDLSECGLEGINVEYVFRYFGLPKLHVSVASKDTVDKSVL